MTILQDSFFVESNSILEVQEEIQKRLENKILTLIYADKNGSVLSFYNGPTKKMVEIRPITKGYNVAYLSTTEPTSSYQPRTFKKENKTSDSLPFLKERPKHLKKTFDENQSMELALEKDKKYKQVKNFLHGKSQLLSKPVVYLQDR